MQVFNTLSGQKENLIISAEKEIKLFVCGLTVYDHAHIGNARTFLAFDIIVRYLRSLGQKIFYLQNITDIDDRIIDRAAREKITPAELAKKFESEYLKDMAALGVDQVTKYARATDHIPEIITQIETLKKGGHAYEIPGDGIYFDLSTFPDYGKLSRRTTLQAEDSVSRVDESIQKRNKGDFALWKFEKPDEPAWDSPFGRGRPGWHIEDTAISEHFFGSQYDIHGGGIDLKFPHHEAEIAQQEAASGKTPFVKIWMHVGHMLVEGQKMSKSLGNFITIKDFPFSPNDLRMLCLMHHYRSPMNYTALVGNQAAVNFLNIINSIEQMAYIADNWSDGSSQEAEKVITSADKEFDEAMADDFNTPQALGALFKAVEAYKSLLPTISQHDSVELSAWLKSKINLFGFKESEPIASHIFSLMRKHEEFRKAQNFAESDLVREEIEKLGFAVMNTARGPLLERKR